MMGTAPLCLMKPELTMPGKSSNPENTKKAHPMFSQGDHGILMDAPIGFFTSTPDGKFLLKRS